VAVTFPNGTSSQAVASAVSPAESVQAIWSYNTAQQRFEAYSPAAPQASDLLSVNFLDAVWVCIAGAPPAPAAVAPTVAPPMAPAAAVAPSDEEAAIGWDLVGSDFFLYAGETVESVTALVVIENRANQWGMCRLAFGIELYGAEGQVFHGLPVSVEYLGPRESVQANPWALVFDGAVWLDYSVWVAWTWCIPGVAEAERSYHEFAGFQ